MNKCAIDASDIKLGCIPRDITYPHEKELCSNIPPYGKDYFLLILIRTI